MVLAAACFDGCILAWSLQYSCGVQLLACCSGDWLLACLLQHSCGVQVMYQLQRGSMLGDVAGHADERALLHSRFLAASTSVALLIMAPALYVFSPLTAAFQQVPALDLALHPGQQTPNHILYRPVERLFIQPNFHRPLWRLCCLLIGSPKMPKLLRVGVTIHGSCRSSKRSADVHPCM